MFSPTIISAIREKLERRLQLIDRASDQDFFPEVVPYLFELVSNPVFRPILDRLNRDKEEDTKKFEQLKRAVESEVRATADVVIGRIRSQQGIAIEVSNAIREFESMATGQIISSSELCVSLYDDLSGLCYAIAKNDGAKLIEDLSIKDSQGRHEDWNLSKSWSSYHDEHEKVEILKRIKPWACWERLVIIPGALWEYKDHWDTIKKNPAALFNWAWLAGEMRKQVDPYRLHHGKAIQESVTFNRSETLQDLRRLHAFILDNLDRTVVGMSLLERFKKRCEWFDQEELKQAATPHAGESKLKRILMRFLFDQGVFPVAESVFGAQRPDILGIHPEEIMPVEVKIFGGSGDRVHVARGFHQIYRYAHTMGEPFGYLVIFNNSQNTLDIPSSVNVADRTIKVEVIHLHGSPSKRKLDRVEISEAFLTEQLGANGSVSDKSHPTTAAAPEPQAGRVREFTHQ